MGGQMTTYRTLKVDRITLSYRDAGHAEAPTILLLRGLPSFTARV